MATTLIPSSTPTQPHKPVIHQSHTPDPLVTVGTGMQAVGAGMQAMAKAGGFNNPLAGSFIIALITSLVVWGGHEMWGGRAIQERLDRQDERIQRLEEHQQEIRFNLASIAKAVGADLYRE